MSNVLYLGNFDYKNGFAAINRAINIGVLLNKNGFSTFIPCSNYNGELDDDNFLKSNSIHLIKKESVFDCGVPSITLINEKIGELVSIIFYNSRSNHMVSLMKYCRKHNIKTIADVTEWYNTRNVSFFKKPFKYLDTTLRMRYLNFKADGIMVISNYLLKYYAKRGKPIIKIPPLMDYTLSLIEECTSCTEKNKTKDCLNICYCGATGKHDSKDELSKLLLFLDSISERIPMNIHFAGIIPEQYKNEVKKYESLNDRCFFYGLLPYKESIKLLKQMDVQIVFRKPQRTTNVGFPSKYSESISIGLPIIITNISDVLDYPSEKALIISNDYFKEKDKILDFLNNIYLKKLESPCNNTRNMFLSFEYIDSFVSFINKIIK